jgi:DNA-binding CsgD family transcriptional regulator
VQVESSAGGGGTRAAESEFVGRAEALATLTDALSAAGEGAASFVVVHGETGIGKTRTVAEFAQVARCNDAVVLWGNCYEGDATCPFGPWVEALEGYLRPLDRRRTRERLGAHGPVLAKLLPRLGSTLADHEPPPAPPCSSDLARLYEAVVWLLDSSPRAPVLVFDDVHWADGDALELLTYVARHARRVLIVVTCRGREIDLSQSVAARLAQIGRQSRCEYVLLDSLSCEESAELLRRVAGQPLDARLAETLHRESGGNPYFLRELGRHLSRHGLPTENGRWRLPETVRHAVALRLAGLSAQGRSILDFASVFTDGFSFTELLTLTELGEDRLLDALDEALAAELIRPIGPERYDYAHPLVRHVLHDGVSPSRRARLHRRLAGVLERTLAVAPEREAELARQYHASAMLPGAERGVRHAVDAALRARAAYARDEAVALLELAREIAPAADQTTRARIESELARVQAEAGMFEGAVHSLESALSLLEAGRADVATIAELVFDVVSSLQDALAAPSDALEALIDRGLAVLGDEHTLEWARLMLLKRPLYAVSSGPIHALRWPGFDPEAVAIARAEGSENDYARSLDFSTPWPLARYDELAQLIGGWQTTPARLRGLSILLMYLTIRRGSGPAAGRLCDELELLAVEVDSLPARALAMTYRTAILGAQGEFSAAIETAARARGLAERLPAEYSWVLGFLDMIADLTAMQIHPDWVGLAEKMHGLALDGEPWWRLLYAALAARAYAKAGMPDRARELLGHLLPILVASDPDHFSQNGCVAFAADAVCELGDREIAQQLMPAATALTCAKSGDWYMTSNELTVARLKTLLGHLEAAFEHFGRARETHAAREQRAPLALAQHDEAQARRSARAPDAARLMAEAKASLFELGMQRGSLARRGTRRTTAALPDGLTAREAEILALITGGRTNKEIAERLVLSVHTVERHIQNAYRKIGARNRADASAYAVREGLPLAPPSSSEVAPHRRVPLAAAGGVA